MPSTKRTENSRSTPSTPETERPKKSWSIRSLWKPKFIQDWLSVWKEHGFRGFVKEKGWKIVIAVVLFYLVRDSILYLALPYFAARGLLGC